MKKNAGKALMLLEGEFPSDPRVSKEAYALVSAGFKVSVIAICNKGDKVKENVEGVNVYRVPKIALFKKGTTYNKHSFIQMFIHRCKAMIGYIFEYFYFTFVSLLLSLYVLVKEGIDIIHAHNPPDTLFIVAAVYKLLGKQFIFDHHDLSPELYLAKFSGKKDLLYKTLLLFEKCSCKLADKIISTNNSYKAIVENRHRIDPNNIQVVRNNPIINDCMLSKVQDKRSRKRSNSLVYLGSINPQDGVDILLKSIHYLINNLNEKFISCHIIGDGDALWAAKQFSEELQLGEYVDFPGFISDREKIKKYLSFSDICVEPASDNEVNRHSTFIKVMEYMAAHKPVVAFDLKETRYSADGSAMLVPPGDIEGFAQGIKTLLDEPQLREELGNAGQERIKAELNWENASRNLTEAYNSLPL
jgi:glycosyltransferase involved in cell wall biosynthesis